MLKMKIRSVVHNKALLAVFLVAVLLVAAFTIVQAMSIGTYDQCANDLGSGYPATDPDPGCHWINGNLQGNTATYAEDDATVQRLWLTGLAPGTHTITLQYGTTKGGTHAYDFLTTWDWSEDWITVADRCQDIPGCEPAIAGGEDKLDIPADPSVLVFQPSAPGNRQFVMIGGDMTAATTPVIQSGTYTSDSETIITITFTVPASGGLNCNANGCDVVLWFGAHVASTALWTAANGTIGAGGIPGSPYHVALELFDNASVGQRDNQMQSAAVQNAAQIIVKKITVNMSGVQIPSGHIFDFTLWDASAKPSPVNLRNFRLSNGQQHVETVQSGRTYSVDEIYDSGETGWSLYTGGGTWTNYCKLEDGTAIGTLDTTGPVYTWSGLAIPSSANHVVTCQFVNQVGPTAVTLDSFGYGKLTSRSVELVWVTSSEVNNAGFNLYREGENGDVKQLNKSLIPAAGGVSESHAYAWTDTTVLPGRTYRYWLGDVETNGVVTQHGPVEVTVPKR